MPIVVENDFKNLRKGLEIPEGDLVILTGSNNSGKSAVLQYLNTHGSIRNHSDYISPRRFDLSNEVAIALNSDRELQDMWNNRKQTHQNVSELTAPDPIRELLALPNDERNKIIAWHNQYFGELVVKRSKLDNDFSAASITIDGRLATQQGSGSRAVLSVLCSLLHPSRKYVLIDEPEIGIEPQVQKQLAKLVSKVSRGEDGLPKKAIYIATHSHLFLDKAVIENNWVVSKGADGIAKVRGLKTPEELHSTVYRLLGNSPEDLFFPDNILITEGVSDQIFLRKIIALRKSLGVAVHFSEGDSKASDALPAIEQMLKTLAYIPWYRDRLCMLVDAGVDAKRVGEWRAYLKDDGTRVRTLSKSGIEYYYPSSIMTEITGLSGPDLAKGIDEFVRQIRLGQTSAPLGAFSGRKRQLALEIENRLTETHLLELSPEIVTILDIVKANCFSQRPI